MAGPEAALLDLALEWWDDFLADRVGEVVGRLHDEVERLDLLTNEVIDPVELLLELGVGLEIPRHGVLLGAGALPIVVRAMMGGQLLEETPMPIHPDQNELEAMAGRDPDEPVFMRTCSSTATRPRPVTGSTA